MKTAMKMSPVIGVTGYLEHTWNVDRTEIPQCPGSVLMVEESSLAHQLHCIIYNEGPYEEIMRRVKKVGYDVVFLYANVIDIRNISDIYRLLRDIPKLNVGVVLYYPDTEYKEWIKDDICRCLCQRAEKVCSADGTIIIEYRPSEPAGQDEAYDIYIGINGETYILPYYMDKDKLIRLARLHHHILLPYASKQTKGNTMGYSEIKDTVSTFDIIKRFLNIISCGSFEEFVMVNTSVDKANLLPLIPRNF